MTTARRSCDLVVGGDSTIGAELIRRIEQSGGETLCTTRRRETAGPARILFDLAGRDRLPLLSRPVGVAYLCAGVASLEHCHRDPQASAWVNVDRTLEVAEELIERNAFVVFLSTNMVFDGLAPFSRADAPHTPKTEYGRQKARVEKALAPYEDRVAVVRLTKMVPPRSRFTEWAAQLVRGQNLKAFDDLRFSPLLLDFTAEALLAIGQRRQGGAWQVGGAGDMSYLQAARLIAQAVGASPQQVEASSAASLPYYESLPIHATLDCRRLRDAFGLQPPEPHEVLAAAVSKHAGAKLSPEDKASLTTHKAP